MDLRDWSDVRVTTRPRPITWEPFPFPLHLHITSLTTHPTRSTRLPHHGHLVLPLLEVPVPSYPGHSPCLAQSRSGDRHAPPASLPRLVAAHQEGYPAILRRAVDAGVHRGYCCWSRNRRGVGMAQVEGSAGLCVGG
jgi:hypothetical protein